MARQALAGGGLMLDGHALEKAAAKLDLAAVEELLERFWTERDDLSEEEREQWKRLRPLRRALLERLAVLDLPRGLRSYPYEARLVLETAARKDGPAALEAWLAFEGDFAKAQWRASVEDELLFQTIEGVGEVPTICCESLHGEALGRLMKGWASSQPEEAWQAALSRTSVDYQEPGVLAGLIDGLRVGSDWQEWAARLEALDWTDFKERTSDNWLLGMFPANPKAASGVALAKQWVLNDPEAALNWLEACEASWERVERFFWINDFNSGSSGYAEAMPLRFLVFASWLENRPAGALTWLADSSHATEDELARMATWADCPARTRMSVITVMRAGEEKDQAALKLASSLMARQSSEGPESMDILGKLAQVEGLEKQAAEAIAKMSAGRQATSR